MGSFLALGDKTFKQLKHCSKESFMSLCDALKQ